MCHARDSRCFSHRIDTSYTTATQPIYPHVIAPRHLWSHLSRSPRCFHIIHELPPPYHHPFAKTVGSSLLLVCPLCWVRCRGQLPQVHVCSSSQLPLHLIDSRYQRHHMSTHSPTGTPTGFWSEATRGGSARSSSPKPQNTNDPPRPAKDGFEWVWYSEGYWAERPLERRPSSKGQGQKQGQAFPGVRLFKWGQKSNRGSIAPQESHQLEPEQQPSPMSPMTQPRLSQLGPPKDLPQSPYLSESAQTAYLQHPTAPTSKVRSDRDTWTSFNTTTTAPIAEVLSSGGKPMSLPDVTKPMWRSIETSRVRPSSKCRRLSN